jgi:putative transposase
MLKAYKYRIYPNQEQKGMMAKIFGQVRFVYNLGLETKINAYVGNKKHLKCFDLNKQITELKNTDAPWLKESPSQALQMSMANLDNAYTNFFKGAGFPNLKIDMENNHFNYLKEYIWKMINKFSYLN